MDVKAYFERVTEKVKNMSDEEFLELLKEAGLDDCPFKDDVKEKHKKNNNE